MGLTVEMLVKSLTVGGQIKDHIQFDTVQKLCPMFTTLYELSPGEVAKGSSFAKGTERVQPTSCPS